MIERLSPFGDGPIGRATPAAGPEAVTPFTLDVPEQGAVPQLPPVEVLDALDRAARVIEHLDRKNIALSIEHDPQTNDVHVTMRHGGASAQHELSLRGLLNVLDGDPAEIWTGTG